MAIKKRSSINEDLPLLPILSMRLMNPSLGIRIHHAALPMVGDNDDDGVLSNWQKPLVCQCEMLTVTIPL